jgi:MFS family permease
VNAIRGPRPHEHSAPRCPYPHPPRPVRAHHERNEPLTVQASESGTALLVPSLLFIALVVAVVGSIGAPLITSVATSFHVSLASAQWTLTITLLTGAVATPLLGRLGSGPGRRTTILRTLAVVVCGSVLTVLPLSFGWLLVGRGCQGVGLGLTALMMGVARDHLPEERSHSVIAFASVASTIGIGVGHPLAGLLVEIGGVRAAGVLVTAVALLAAVLSMPSPPASRAGRIDLPDERRCATAEDAADCLADTYRIASGSVLASATLLLICSPHSARVRAIPSGDWRSQPTSMRGSPQLVLSPSRTTVMDHSSRRSHNWKRPARSMRPSIA